MMSRFILTDIDTFFLINESLNQFVEFEIYNAVFSYYHLSAIICVAILNRVF